MPRLSTEGSIVFIALILCGVAVAIGFSVGAPDRKRAQWYRNAMYECNVVDKRPKYECDVLVGEAAEHTPWRWEE